MTNVRKHRHSPPRSCATGFAWRSRSRSCGILLGNLARFPEYSSGLEGVEPAKDGTILTWDEYYNAQDLDVSRAEFGQAFADTGENLTRYPSGNALALNDSKCGTMGLPSRC